MMIYKRKKLPQRPEVSNLPAAGRETQSVAIMLFPLCVNLVFSCLCGEKSLFEMNSFLEFEI